MLELYRVSAHDPRNWSSADSLLTGGTKMTIVMHATLQHLNSDADVVVM